MTQDGRGQPVVVDVGDGAVPPSPTPRRPKRREPKRNPAYWERKAARRRAEEYKAKRRPYHVAYNRQRRTGITPELYAELVDLQEGACLLCFRVMKLHVDHDHVTGRIRGLLCSPCNTALFRAETDPTWFDRARRYLEP